MAEKIHANHGRDHGEFGSDPIPASGTTPGPIVQDLLAGAPWGSEVRNGSWTVTLDASTYSNVLATSTTSLGNWIAGVAVVSPRYALFGVELAGKKDTDAGQFVVEITNAVEDIPGEGLLFDGKQMLDDPLDEFVSDHVWTTLYRNGTSPEELYAAAPAEYASAAIFFRLSGSPGDVISTATYDDDGNGYWTLNGGPGLYWLRVRSTGKNASSSGYRIRLRAFRLARYGWGGYH